MHNLFKKILTALQKEHFAIGKTRIIDSWAWLFVGILGGVVLGIALVANWSGEFISADAAVNPVAFWKLDDSAGTKAVDSSGNINNGTLKNGPVWTVGKEGGALNFDGLNDFVSVPNSSSLNITGNAMTISAWVNVSANPSYTNWGVVSKRGWDSGYRLMIKNTNKVGFELTGKNGYSVTSANSIASGQWTHIAGVYDGAKMKIYIDGAADPNEKARTGSINSTTYGVTIGTGDSYSGCPGQTWCYLYKGLIDNVRIYNRALSQSEIQEEISATSTSPSQDIEVPSVNITSPLSGATISGTVNVTVSASDNIGVTKVELWKDGVLFGAKTASPYTFNWDTNQDTNASHNLQAKAYDTALNVGTSGVVNVSVNNISSIPAEIIIDNDTTGASKTGTWCVSGATRFYGTNSLYSCGSALDTYRWSPSLPGTTHNTYEISMWWTSHVNRSTSVPIKILANVGGIQTSTTVYVNQQINGGKWNSLGTFLLGSGSYVETNDLQGQASADAVRFVKVISPAPTASLSVADITSDFEMGSGFNFVDIAPNTIQIDAELENGKTYTHTPYFKIQQDALGKNPIFKIRFGWGGYHSYLYNPAGTPDTPNASWVYSYDNINWVRFPAGSTHYDLASDAVTMRSPVFTQNTVYISPLIPYGYTTDYMSDKARWVANSNVTLSTLGTSVEGRSIELFTITNVSSLIPEASKKVYFIIRSGHPIEQHTSWRLRGMIDWVLSNDPEAIRFRDKAILKATFSANVDGWVAGSFRINAHGQDMNRDYEYTGANPALEEPETYAIHRAIEKYMATNHIDVFMDMHDSSSPSGGEQLYRAYSMPNSTSLTQLMTTINGLDTSNLINNGINSYHYPITTYTDGVYGQYASRGIKSFTTEGGASFHQNGSYVTKASAQEAGKIFIKAFFKWLVP